MIRLGEIQYFEDGIDVILQELKKVLVKKQKDYGQGNILSFGELGILVRTNDKIERLKNLILNKKVPDNESIEDTWVDLANYGIIALMLRKGYFTLPLKDNG